MHALRNDLQYAFRRLRNVPGFSLVCILTLALGIGANTAVFSGMNAVLLRSLPVSDPDRVIYLTVTRMPDNANNTGNYQTSFSYPVYEALRQQHQAFSSVIAYVPLSFAKTAVRFGQTAEEAQADMVSGDFFSGLGVRLERGRGFTFQDEAGHAPVAVISYGYWTRRFSRSPDVLGATLYVKGIPFTIIGVAAEGFEGVESGDSTDLWVPLQNRPELNAWGVPVENGKTYLSRPDWWCLRMLARLAPGISAKRAVAEALPVFQNAAYIGIGSPAAGEKRPVLGFRSAENFAGVRESYSKPLDILMGMVGLVLLIALCNVSLLLASRNRNRLREFSLQLAIGAGKTALFRELLAESLLLVGAGGVLAWIFAIAATRALGAWSSIEASLAPDRVVLGFTLAILTLAALLFSLLPLRTAMRAGPMLALRSSATLSNSGIGRSRAGRSFLALQLALCMVLLVGAGLLIRTLQNLENIPLGMRTEGLVVFGITPQNMHSQTETLAFYSTLLERLRVLPGVRAVTFMENRLGSGWSNNFGTLVDGKTPPNARGEEGEIRSNDVGPDFFHTLGVPILAGRDFSDSDTATSPKVAIINETFANRYLPNENPLGHHIGGKEPKDQAVVVGVVKDHKYSGIEEDPVPMAWFASGQNDSVGAMNVEMRVQGKPLAILPAVRKAVASLDPNIPLQQPMTQQAQFEDSIAMQELFARLSGFFGILAMLLVATGLYGTFGYQVNSRTVEIGVRLAVGAQRWQIMEMVLRESLWLTGIGMILGAPLALLVSHALSASLYGVKPYDAVVYFLALLGMTAVAVTASLVPARRAANLDPMNALRAE